MSRRIKLDSLTDEDIKKLNKDLQVQQEASKYAFNSQPTYISLFEAEDNDVYIPFSYDNKYMRPSRKDLPEQNVKFCGKLREDQKKVKTEAIERLNSHGSVLISCYTGYGKSALAVYIASKIKMKTLIICNRIVLINQWKGVVKHFCPTSSVQILSAKSVMEDVDFYIINAANISKHIRTFYKEIGLVIVDEAHLIMAAKLSCCMRYLLPRYVVGLTATPYRMDGLNILLDMYFGKYKIVRKLFRKHTVYRVDTGFKPDVELNKTGKVDWNSVLNSQCGNEPRNELIIKIIKYFPDRVFLILCKRVEQAKYLETRLKEEKEDVTSLIGKNQEYEQNSRILVGTVGKTGVGFDHPRLNSLLLASDVEQYFIQYLGRVFRTQEVEPLIFDLVDNFALLLKHFRTRNSVYVEHGGIVKSFAKEFPNF
jgi:superfamily II DNA or RNA helicase